MEKDLKKFILKIAKESARITKQGFKTGRQITWKPDKSPVTPTDFKVNNYLVKEIKKYFPNHSIISEELPAEIRNSKYTWYIDPIDGTIPFSQGIDFFTNSIGLAKGKEVILATVCDPIRNELFFAQKGKGAYLNGKRIKSAARQNLSQALIDFEIWKRAPYDLYELKDYLTRRIYVESRQASLAICLCYVAIGRMDAVIFGGNLPWDIAASYLICQEAGVKCSNLDGTIWHPGEEVKGLIAARPKLHKELVKITRKYL